MMQENLSSGFPTRYCSNQPAQFQRLVRELKCCKFAYYTFQTANNKAIVQTEHMRRLVSAFVVHITQRQVFSWHSSNSVFLFCYLISHSDNVLLTNSSFLYQRAIYQLLTMSSYFQQCLIIGNFSPTMFTFC